MTLRSVSRRLTGQIISAAMHVSPRDRQEWAQAMSREADEIPNDREALRWALGCLLASWYERWKSMRLTSWWPVRWGMALWLALVASDGLAYAGFTLAYKLGLSPELYPYPPNIRLLGVTPLYDPIMALVAGVVLLVAVVLILRRKRGAFVAVVVPNVVMLLLFVVRVSRPESGIQQSLAHVYRKSPFEMIWPIAGMAITILIFLALWQDWRTPAPR
jgi:hypothetical protein